MFDKLEDIERRWRQAGLRLYEPEVINNNELYTQLLKDQRELTPVAEKYREYKTAKSNFDGAKEMLDAGGLDPELKELAAIPHPAEFEKYYNL